MRILDDGIPKRGKCLVYVNGKWRAYVYYKRGKKQFRRLWVKPRDPRKPGQLAARARFGAASHGYSDSRQVTEEDRERLRAEGAKVRSRPWMGQSGPLTGQQYHVRITCKGKGRRQNEECRSGDGGGVSEVRQGQWFTQATSEGYWGTARVQPGQDGRREKAEGRRQNAEVTSQVGQWQGVGRCIGECCRSITVTIPWRVAGVLGIFSVAHGPNGRSCGWSGRAGEVEAGRRWQGAGRGPARSPPAGAAGRRVRLRWPGRC